MRLAVAGLVAVVSLIQMPSMVTAASGSVARQHEYSLASHAHHEKLPPSHHHHPQQHAAGEDVIDAGDDAYGIPACHVAGCCLALNPVIGSAPSVFYLALGPVDMDAARVMVPALPDPTVPPPRLQA
ncbi:MAG: hypothetical protein K2Y71_23195 [Xanthobacteraceae bacterium]|nr:hypothetical protein [Xanthobacteraceae bacterium]